jgi:5-methylcytosine-specific restriction protein A
MTHAFEHVPRKQFTDQQRAKIFLERGGKCHKCERKLGSGDDWILEHIVALQNGGTNADSNMGVTCSWCLPAKNKADAGLAAKGRAQAVAHVIPTSQRRKKGPPIPGSRRSKFKRKMDGTTVRRDQP